MTTARKVRRMPNLAPIQGCVVVAGLAALLAAQDPATPATTASPSKNSTVLEQPAVTNTTPTAPSETPKTAPAKGSSTPSTTNAPRSPSVTASPANERVVPWEYQPYRIQVWIAAEATAELGPPALAELQRELERQADAMVGAPWQLIATEPPAALYQTIAQTPLLLNDAAIAAANKQVLKDDKLIVVRVSGSPRGLQLVARELDCHARVWGPTVTRDERQLANLPTALFDAVREAFLPAARIEEGEGKTCTVRGKATGLVLDASSPAHLGKGDVLRPTMRQNDKYGEPQKGKTDTLPFTYLHITGAHERFPTLLNCNIHSGMRTPIRGRSTSRRERWAIKVRPRFGSTELLVESKPYRGETKVTLSGIEVFSKTYEPEPPREETDEEKAAAEKKSPPELLGVTDWRGAVRISVGGPVLRVLYIRNGSSLLARLPMVAGLDESALAEVANDNPRLQAEGFVKGLNAEVTDLVVQRQLIALRMKKKIAEGKLDDAQKLFDEFRDLKTLNDLQAMINSQLQRQKPALNPYVRNRIEKLYSDERELLAKYIDNELQSRLLVELNTARNAPPPSATPPVADPNAPAAETKKKTALPGLQKKGGDPDANAPASPPGTEATTPGGAAPPPSQPGGAPAGT